jgi:DNA-binding CsgD family transcriptional regulator
VLVGREAAATALARTLAAPGLTVLAGPPGIGKSALAEQLAGVALEAERQAESAGPAVLLGRARRALRAHGIVRRAAPAGGGLSAREREVPGLVGRGLSTRRIAELLGITRHTTETYVKSGMAKLGARTRTEAAVRAAGSGADAGGAAATPPRDPAEV